MTNVIKLNFDIVIKCENKCASDLGKDLASWLKESWFNGEDVLDVEFVDYKVI